MFTNGFRMFLNKFVFIIDIYRGIISVSSNHSLNIRLLSSNKVINTFTNIDNCLYDSIFGIRDILKYFIRYFIHKFIVFVTDIICCFSLFSRLKSVDYI